MRLNKADLAKKLGCSERTLSTWQREGLPVLEHGSRGHANLYDLAAVVAWLKRTGRGSMRAGYGQRPIDIGALERELGLTAAPARAAAGDLYRHLAQHGVVPMAVHIVVETHHDAGEALYYVGLFFDSLYTTFSDRYGNEFYDDSMDGLIDAVIDEEHPDRARLVDRVNKAAAAQLARRSPQLPLEAPLQMSAQGAPADGPHEDQPA